MSLDTATFKAGSEIKVAFPEAMQAKAGEKFWIAICEADAPDTAWGQYKYLDPGLTELELDAVAAAGK